MARFLLSVVLVHFIIDVSFAQNLEPETLVDHSQIIRSLDKESLQNGKVIYQKACSACHGKDGTSVLPAARSFNTDEFKYGGDPYSMWRNITNGVGQMGAQRWLTPEEAYSVVQYIREDLVDKNSNPSSYFKITDEYLANLPKTVMSTEQVTDLIKRKALKGSQKYGQEYFSEHPGNYGQAIYSQLKDYASSALTINLGQHVSISYNVHRMSPSVAWMGNLDLSRTKYQLYRGDWEPEIDGEVLSGFDGMHWSFTDRFHQLENLVSDRSPYPAKWLDYHGHYQHRDNIVLSYSIVGRDVLEIPSADILNNQPVIQHTYNIDPGDSWRKIVIGKANMSKNNLITNGVYSLKDIDARNSLPKDQWKRPENSLIVSFGEDQKVTQFLAAGVQGDTKGMRWLIEKNNQLALFIPPSDRNQIIRLHRYGSENIQDLYDFAAFLIKSKDESIPNPAHYTEGSDRQWGKTITLEGELNTGVPHYDPIHYKRADRSSPEYLVQIPQDYPYVVDRIPLPFRNPWKSWIRPSGLDFFPDGRLVMSTYAGDVWAAEGVDKDLKQVKWQRIATGLYDPFGLKVVDDEIYVTCRDRIVRLKDLNGDGETDFYESFFADTDVSHTPVQAFNYSLQSDSKGNLYYSKGGQYTSDDEAGHVIRVTPDGKTQESVAIGFRAPNGVTIGPEDDIYVSDNQGTWMPANKINLIEKGNFYGYIPSIGSPSVNEYRMRAPLGVENYPSEVLPDTFDKPIIWLPQEFDSSPGGGAWTPKDWGPLSNRMIHTSYGKGWVYQVLMQEIDGITQAAVSALPFQFSAGIQRARINPADGQFYIAGITGWDDGFATKYGSLDRIRYVGGKGFFIDAVEVRKDGVALSFNQKLNEDAFLHPDSFQIEQWNYRWTQNYGSAHWTVRNPDVEGHDIVEVKDIEIENDGKSLVLKLPDLVPVDQMRIRLSLNGENGQSYKDVIYLTIHNIPDHPAASNSPLIWILGVLSLMILLFALWRIANS